MSVLLVGLGNPGDKYHNTRHNLGWDAMEEIQRLYSIAAPTSRFKGLFASGQVAGDKLHWLLPQTYMNLSGESVGEAARYYKVEPENVIVFHDDMDLALGKIKIKKGGGNGGHNGLKSIQQHLGTPNFVRVRLGIGRPPAQWEPVKYVLAHFTAEERKLLEPVLAAIAKQALPPLLDGEIAQALNHLGRALRPPPKEKRPKGGQKGGQKGADPASQAAAEKPVAQDGVAKPASARDNPMAEAFRQAMKSVE
uniref:Peptidyl-tRNA hydrolase n=1 Tax=Magnetococcus massalia (strain MO-1) TaxID=451514 RepID=A0A1S7LIA8_MAGMO|nr:Peptidyl-tRNA hydrolase [Candidatus Magnetococcus massalia]